MEDKSYQYDYLAKKANPYRLIAAIYLFGMTSISIILIISLLISIYLYTKGNKIKNDLILCIILLCFDLLSCIMGNSDALLSIINYRRYISTQALCNLGGSLNYITYTTSINLLGILSLERCLLIVYKRKHSSKFYFSFVLIFLIFNIINAIQTSITKGFNILPNAIYCLFDPSTTGGLIGSLLCGISCGIAYTILVFCYLSICIHRRNESKKAQLELGLDPVKVRKEVNSTIIKSLSIMITNLFTSGVYIAIMAVSWFYPAVLTNVTDMIQVIFIQPQIIINTILLLVMKPDLWNGLRKLYGFNSE